MLWVRAAARKSSDVQRAMALRVGDFHSLVWEGGVEGVRE